MEALNRKNIPSNVNYIRKIVLNLYFWPSFAFTTVLALVLIPMVAFLVAFLGRRPSAPLFRKGVQCYGRVLIKAIPFMAPVHLENRAGVITGPAVFVANHSSSADPFCFGVLKQDIAFLTSWPFDIPFFSGIMKHAEYIDTRQGWEEVRKKSKRLLAEECSLVIWPEGHRSVDGSLGIFQRGAFYLACEFNCPVIPVCIVNTDKLLPRGRRLLTPVRPKVILLPPVWPEAGSDDRNYVKKICRDVRRLIAMELEKQNHSAGKERAG